MLTAMAPWSRRTVWYLVFITILLVSAAEPLHADVYLYVDEEGNRCFTNMIPRTSNYRVIIRERKPFSVSYSTDRYDEHIREASRKYDLSMPLLKAVIKTESDFDPQAVSKKGAKGLMQIMPSNFQPLGIRDPFDPRESIMGGALHLRRLLDRFRGDIRLALAAYNAGVESVERSEGIPPFPETKDYVRKVIKFYELFREG